jgi:hypothetical protein
LHIADIILPVTDKLRRFKRRGIASVGKNQFKYFAVLGA